MVTKPRWRCSAWTVASALASLVVLVPILVVFSSVFRDTQGTWLHLVQTRLPTYAINTLILSVCVCLLSAIIGTGTAWLVAMYQFPGRAIVAWGLLLPLAVPAYVAAYGLTDLLQYSGPIQSWIREITGWQRSDYWFPDMRTLGGAVVVLTGALYPYVYVAALTAFREQSTALLEASRLLGRGPWQTFFRVALPLARPSIAAGTFLVLMETVADFGVVDYCAVDTFATGIYRTWVGLESRFAAAQLASLLLTALFLLIVLEAWVRRRQRQHHTTTRCARRDRRRLGPAASALALLACATPILIGFVLPAGRFGSLVARGVDMRTLELLLDHGLNTATLAFIAATGVIAISIVMVYARRLNASITTRAATRLGRAGYALPGPVVAIGILIPLSWLDHRTNETVAWLFGPDARPGLILTGSIVAVLVGYHTRFLSVGIAFVESSFTRVHRSVDDAARVLGARPWWTLCRIHLPLMKGSLIAAWLLVFVDVAKELPATLMLRPFNFDTLAVRVYQLAADERLEEASTGALALIAIAIVPVLLLARLAHVVYPRETAS